MRLLDRHDQHRGDRREHGAEREDGGIDAVDRDAEGLRGLAVVLRGAHDEAEPGARQHEPGGDEQRERGGDDDELVAGIAEPGELRCGS